MSASLGNSQDLYLDQLNQGIPVISARGAGLLIECCMYCMHTQGHLSGVSMSLNIANEHDNCNIHWDDVVTDEWKYRYDGNDTKTTEHGATAIALLVIKNYSDFTAVREAYKGTRVDYILSRQDLDEDTYIFEKADAYLEIRGIRREAKGNTIIGAARKKAKRLTKAIGIDTSLSCHIAVVEFSQPHTRVET